MKFHTTFVLLECSTSSVLAFAPFHTSNRERVQKIQILAEKTESWNVGDDWSSLSSDSPNNAMDGSSIFNIDPVMQVARDMSYSDESSDYQPSDEESFITGAVDTIYGPILDSETPALYDTEEVSFDEYTKTETFSDEMGREISLLVRCNESPDQLLVSLGRRLPKLEEDEKYDPEQLLTTLSNDGAKSGKKPQPTEFFESAVRGIYHMHASPTSAKGENSLVLFPDGISSWMSQSLGEKVGKFDRRVTIILGKYSTHGSGFLTEDQFLSLYMDAATIAGAPRRNTVRGPTRNKKRDDGPTIESVWRDLENHGFRPPIVEKREVLQQKLEEEFGAQKVSKIQDQNMMDECEILEWKDDEHSTPRASSSSQMKGATSDTKKSSHEFVALARDNKTPSRLRGGDFVFIDEESCIGCQQCASVAPSSFQILDNGRARTFMQSNMPEVDTAISVCPVGCMHKVAFHELVEMETSRDVEGDFLTKGHIPLNVARIDSDANRKSSWYHSLKHKCYTSKSCPQRGCFDCPMYNEPGANPHFKRSHQKSEHIRATDLIKTGEANPFRKISDL